MQLLPPFVFTVARQRKFVRERQVRRVTGVWGGRIAADQPGDIDNSGCIDDLSLVMTHLAKGAVAEDGEVLEFEGRCSSIERNGGGSCPAMSCSRG